MSDTADHPLGPAGRPSPRSASSRCSSARSTRHRVAQRPRDRRALLAELSDEQLADIGLTRGDITGVARSLAQR